jgi:hypothetical protein
MRECEHCGSAFESANAAAKFCSGSCRVGAHRVRHAVDPITGPAVTLQNALQFMTRMATEYDHAGLRDKAAIAWVSVNAMQRLALVS